MSFLSGWTESLSFFLEDHLMGILMALGLVVVGVIVAAILTKAIGSYVLSYLKLNEWGAKILGLKELPFNLEKLISKLLFFVLLLFLGSRAAEMVQIQGLSNFMDELLAGMSHLGGLAFTALLPIALALIFSYLVKIGVQWLGKQTKLDQRVGVSLEQTGSTFSLTKSLSEVAYGLVFLYFLPDILSGIKLDRLSQSISIMLEEVVSFAPRLAVAGLIVFLGWFVARLLRNTLEGLLSSLSVDEAVNKVFGHTVLGSLKISKVVPVLLYAVVLILAVVQAMEKLQLDTLTQPLQKLIDGAVFNFPKTALAVAMVVGAVYIGKWVAQFVSSLLKDMGFDGIYAKLGLSEIKTSQKTLSEMVGVLVSAAIVALALIQSLNTMGLQSFSKILENLILQSGNVLLGVFVFGVGLYIAKMVSTWVEAAGLSYSKLLSFVVRVFIMVIAGAMALQQIGIADEIVRIAFALTMGSVALGVALAIGLGGKPVAEEWVKSMASKFKN